MEAMCLPHRMSEFGHVTVSMGVASIVPKAGDIPHTPLKAADDALYSAKDSGSSRIIITSFD
jgi:PleD family two-component response regulator